MRNNISYFIWINPTFCKGSFNGIYKIRYSVFIELPYILFETPYRFVPKFTALKWFPSGQTVIIVFISPHIHTGRLTVRIRKCMNPVYWQIDVPIGNIFQKKGCCTIWKHEAKKIFLKSEMWMFFYWMLVLHFFLKKAWQHGWRNQFWSSTDGIVTIPWKDGHPCCLECHKACHANTRQWRCF